MSERMVGMTTWPQPHEGVVGTQRSEPFLSLDESVVSIRDLLRGIARHLQTATLVGNPAPVVARMGERIRAPQPGDLVVEQSVLYGEFDERGIKGVGILLLERREWWTSDEDWQAEIDRGDVYPDEERLTDHAWYVQYGPQPGDVCRWTNCSFVVIPAPDERFSPTVGTRDGNAVVLTGDDLRGSLADSGFSLRASSDSSTPAPSRPEQPEGTR